MGLICFGTNLLGSFALATRIYTPTTPRGYFSYAEPLIYFGTNERRCAASGLCVNSLVHGICASRSGSTTKNSVEKCIYCGLKNMHDQLRREIALVGSFPTL